MGTVFESRRAWRVARWIGKGVLRVSGWRAEGGAPAAARYVVVAVPHTSNWDFPLTLALCFATGVEAHWMAKAAIFHRPFGAVLRWLGGIPVDFEAPRHLVDRTIRAFRENERYAVIIAPEGARARVARWKRGFHHIARGAGVPVVLGFLDYRRRVGGFGPMLWPSDDFEADVRRIRSFYRDVTPRHPDGYARECEAPQRAGVRRSGPGAA